MSAPIRVGIFGAQGRMGQRIAACAQDLADIEIVARFDRAVNIGRIDACDVVIDFSLADATETLLALLKGHTPGLVTGVTGRSPDQEIAIENLAQTQAVFRAANFSLGIAVLNRLVYQAVNALGPRFDAEVFELHHRKKNDAPSGTALQLGATAAEAAGMAWPESRRVREGPTPARSAHEIGTAALRGGTVAGEHTVFLLGDAERLELTHRATNRDVFAFGALSASRWLAQQPAGLYTMQSMLNF
ncbi:MAG: 4-hydroxy-tetrahydrodipicolinate reductase [Myxococcota bacterium]|nr:4-hydroxy-tetrahydrodipicolinate reductase [Myxococcota bacterium]